MNLCLVVAEETVDQAAAVLDRYADSVPLFEVRADFLADLGPDTAAALRKRTERKLIFTARLPADGGRWTAGESAREKAYRRALDAGFDYVDLEIGAFPDLDPGGRTRVIRSFHDMGGMPRDIREIFSRACENPGEIPKLAVTLAGPEDTIRFLEWNTELRASGPAPRVVTAMGRRGAFSRILGNRLGIAHTYVPVPGKILLPGMVDLDTLTVRYRVDRIDDRTAVYGLVEPASTYVPPEAKDPEELPPDQRPGPHGRDPAAAAHPGPANTVLVPFVLDSPEEARAVRDFFRIEGFYSRNSRSS
jgi:3-dehydroquinate dehydratase type I